MITPKRVIMITCVKYPKSLISNFKSIKKVIWNSKRKI